MVRFLVTVVCAIEVNVVAPEDPRKEGGIKFDATFQVSTLQELEDAFIEAHSKTFDIHYSPPLSFTVRGRQIASLDGLEDGASVRLYKRRGIKDRQKVVRPSVPDVTEERSEGSEPLRDNDIAVDKVGAKPGDNDTCDDTQEDPAFAGRSDAATQTTRVKTSDDPEVAFQNLALGGDITRQAAEDLLTSGFRHPFLPMRILHMLSKTENDSEENKRIIHALLRLLVLVPLETVEDRQHAMRLATCNNTQWEILVMKHFAEFPKATGVLRVAECNAELRKKLIKMQFEKQEGLRELWQTMWEPAEEYIGQQHARDIVFPKLQEQMFKRRISDAPLSFLFVGPSGTGKTELARRIASILHGVSLEELNGDGRFVEFKMGNYASEEQFTQWIGVPDGVKGGEGHLTTALKKHPNAVIYLDEIEKARSSAGDRLLGFLDAHGTLQVAKTGEHVKTNKATWILSSNIATAEVLATWRSHLTKDGIVSDYAAASAAVESAIQAPLAASEMFRAPELRNRLSAVVPFTPFKSDEVEQIVQLQMQRLKRKYAASDGYRFAEINWTPKVVDHFTNANREETLMRGNLRSLIKMVENDVNSALAEALDCQDPLCDALAPEGHLCNFVADKGHFLVELHETKLQGPHIVMRHLPATIEEAEEACAHHDIDEDSASFPIDGSTPKTSQSQSQSHSSSGEANSDGGIAVDSDVFTDVLTKWWWDFAKIVDTSWDTLRRPTLATVVMVAFYSYGFFWATAAFFVVHALDYSVSFLRSLWNILPAQMKAAIVMGVKQFGGFVVKHRDITSVLAVGFFFLVCKNLLTRCCRRRNMHLFNDEEGRNKRLAKLIRDTLDERDTRLLKLILDSKNSERDKLEPPHYQAKSENSDAETVDDAAVAPQKRAVSCPPTKRRKSTPPCWTVLTLHAPQRTTTERITAQKNRA